MSIVTACATTFVSGAIVEGLCAKWVLVIGQRRAALSALISMVFAAAMLAGIGQALRGSYPALCWIAGYGAGCYVAVRWG